MNWKEFKERANYIPDDMVNATIMRYHEKHGDRHQEVASPSSITDCPRLVWLKYRQHVAPTMPKTWALKQRLMLGRNFESVIADQLKEDNALLHWWKDDKPGESIKFTMGDGLTRIEGTPDLLLKFGKEVYISDAKTGRSDGYGYVPIDDTIWEDWGWYKYKLQVTAYYMLAHHNAWWFKENNLPLPTACHLFSYAMDDGLIRRSLIWKPTAEDVKAVMFYIKRWNAAFMSDTMPACTCREDGNGKPVMFCDYGHKTELTKKGKKIVVECCSDDLIKLVKERKV